MKTLICLFLFSLAFVAVFSQSQWPEDIGAYHFHTYFFEENEEFSTAAMDFRKELRNLIDNGELEQCSLHKVYRGVIGPHPYSQWELCCNATSYARAYAHHIQNHGNLTVLIHPLTVRDYSDHDDRVAWIGPSIPLDLECGCLYEELPVPRHCPVYPYYEDVVPGPQDIEVHAAFPGSEGEVYEQCKQRKLAQRLTANKQ